MSDKRQSGSLDGGFCRITLLISVERWGFIRIAMDEPCVEQAPVGGPVTPTGLAFRVGRRSSRDGSGARHRKCSPGRGMCGADRLRTHVRHGPASSRLPGPRGGTAAALDSAAAVPSSFQRTTRTGASVNPRSPGLLQRSPIIRTRTSVCPATDKFWEKVPHISAGPGVRSGRPRGPSSGSGDNASSKFPMPRRELGWAVGNLGSVTE